MMNGRNLSALQPRVNDSLVIFPVKRASDPWGIQAPLPKSDKRKRHCQRKVARTEFSTDDRELGRPELTPLGECGGAVELEIVS